MRTLMIHGRKVLPGERAQINVPIAKLPSHTLIDLPVIVLRGTTPGPNLLLSAGIHGDEINGIETLRRLLQRPDLHPHKGSVLIMPLVNIYGFIHRSRTLPDGKDLNRSFPGGKQGSLARQVAHIVMTKVLPNIDLGVDFHTGGNSITNYPQIRVHFEHDKAVEYAKAFGAPYVLNSGLISNSFRKEAAKKGKPILVYEGGEALRLDDFAIEEGVAGVFRLMKYLGMIPGAVEASTAEVMEGTTWVRAKISGVFSSQVSYGKHVKRNQVIAEINDPFGQTCVQLKSPMEGVVVGLNNMPVVNAGDALIHLAHH